MGKDERLPNGQIPHCAQWESWIQGKPRRAYKQAFIGRLLGRLALRTLTKDDKPIGRNIPTAKEFQISDTGGDIVAEKKKWVALHTPTITCGNSAPRR